MTAEKEQSGKMPQDGETSLEKKDKGDGGESEQPSKEKAGESEIKAAEEKKDADGYTSTLQEQEVAVDMSKLNRHLTCSLCKGYFREAHTVSECLHTFCKSCIFKHYHQNGNTCPECNLNLGPVPLSVTKPDHWLQTLVDKLVPSAKEEDEEAEKIFYAERNIPLKRKYQKDTKSNREPAPKRRPAALDMSFQLVPEEPENGGGGDFKSLKKPFLRTSKKLRIGQLKKYLASKLELQPSEKIEVSCRGEALGDEHELEFIAKTRWRDCEGDLKLNYRKSTSY